MPASAEPSLNEIIEIIEGDDAYSDGRRALPYAISSVEALLVVDDIYAATRAADATIFATAEEMNQTIACSAACPGRCCEPLILVSEPEALAIARELRRPEMVEQRRLFLERLPRWESAVGQLPRRAAAALAAGDNAGYLEAMNQHGLVRAMCPFNSASSCDIHAARPLPCRKLWVVDTWENCGASADPDRPQVLVISHPAFEELFERVKRVCAGLQNGMGKGVNREPLPTAVARLR